jgi:hypothetical protein
MKKEVDIESGLPGTSIGHLMKKNYLPNSTIVYENT